MWFDLSKCAHIVLASFQVLWNLNGNYIKLHYHKMISVEADISTPVVLFSKLPNSIDLFNASKTPSFKRKEKKWWIIYFWAKEKEIDYTALSIKSFGKRKSCEKKQQFSNCIKIFFSNKIMSCAIIFFVDIFLALKLELYNFFPSFQNVVSFTCIYGKISSFQQRKLNEFIVGTFVSELKWVCNASSLRPSLPWILISDRKKVQNTESNE